MKPEWVSGLVGFLPPTSEQGSGELGNIRQLCGLSMGAVMGIKPGKNLGQ